MQLHPIPAQEEHGGTFMPLIWSLLRNAMRRQLDSQVAVGMSVVITQPSLPLSARLAKQAAKHDERFG